MYGVVATNKEKMKKKKNTFVARKLGRFVAAVLSRAQALFNIQRCFPVLQ